MKKALLTLTLLAGLGCATVKADAKADWQAIVTCAKVDPANAAIKAAAESCIASATTGNYAACLTDFLPVSTWSEDEIACVAAKTGPK